MAIKKHELEKMNTLLESGKKYSDIAKIFTQYDYWEIVNEVSVFSLLGKKRMISNRLKKLKSRNSKEEREKLIIEIKGQLDEIYLLAKKNGKKLIDINKIIDR